MIIWFFALQGTNISSLSKLPKSTSDAADSLPITVTEIPSLSSPFQDSSIELLCHEHSEESMAFNDCYDISSPNFKEMIDLYFKSMHSMTQEEIDLIHHLISVISSHSISYCWSIFKRKLVKVYDV